MSVKRKKIEQADLQGLKYFKLVNKLLESLHNVGTERDRAGNRELHMDQHNRIEPRQTLREAIESGKIKGQEGD